MKSIPLLKFPEQIPREGHTPGPLVSQLSTTPHIMPMDIMPTPGQSSNSRLIDRYQIIKTLGEGSFGKVKLAFHLPTNSRVALKIINRKTLAKSDMQGRVEREISYLRLLRHPHIIKLYEVIKSKEEIIMVMEYAGKELFDYIVQKGRMSEKDARRFFQQIIGAVQYCHRHQIVHRDLKPENLLLDEKMDIKIADFGLSNIMTDGNFLKTSCGSPNYAAPEVISGRLYAGPEVDVWSCGVILYVMLCGRLPFDDESIPELFKKISMGQYSIPDYVGPGPRALLQKMLVVDPLQRITVDQIMDDNWFKQGIPEYLLPVKDDSKAHSYTPQDNVVQVLAQTLGYTPEMVVKSLNAGEDSVNTDEIQDAHRILVNNMTATATGDTHFRTDELEDYMKQRAIEKKKQEEQQSTDGVPSTFGFDANHLGPVGVGQSKVSILPQSLPQYHLAYMESKGIKMTKHLSPTQVKKSKTRWHYGIRSRSYPLDVMGEIYRALHSLGAEWTDSDDIWMIHVRWQSPEDKETLNMRIQLYQLEQNNYLVDFKFDGFEHHGKTTSTNFCAYPFLRLSTKLIMELAVNSQGE